MALADLLDLRYVEIGKIKIGGKAKEARESRSGGSWRPPEKYDHFIITTLFRDETDNLIHDVAIMDSLKDYADKKDGKLRSIPVMFGSNDIEEVLQTSYTWYIGKTCGARTDGKTLTFYSDPKTGQRLAEPIIGAWSPDWLTVADPTSRAPKKMFKRFTNLNCMIASPAARFGGYYRFRTTSEISSRQLYGTLTHFVGTAETRGLSHGVLRGLPFRLVVRPMAVSPDGKPTTVHVVHVEYMHGDLKALQAAAAEQRMLELNAVEQTLQTQVKYRELLAHVAANDEPDDDLVPDEELPVLPLPGKAPDPAQKRAEEKAIAMEAIDKAIAAAETAAALKAVWDTEIKPAQRWSLLDEPQREAVKTLWKKRTDAIANPPPKPAETPAPEAAGGPGSPNDENTPLEHEGEDAPDAEVKPDEPQPPLKAGKTILDAILKLLNGKPYEEVRAAHAEELGITSARMADLTADQALKLIEKMKGGAK